MQLNRRHLLALAGSAYFASNFVAQSLPSRGRLSLGLTGPTYYSGFNPFLNWWKIASDVETIDRAGTVRSGKAAWDAGYFDPTSGEIRHPAPRLASIARIFFTSMSDYQYNAGCNYSGERWVAEWEGSAIGQVNFLTKGGEQRQIGSNSIEFQMGTRPGNTQLRLILKDPNDPPRNVRVFQKRYQAAVRDGQIFNPDWIAEVKNFDTLRLMGWDSTNNSEVQAFSELANENYVSWCGSLSSNSRTGPKGGIHPSIICKLADKTGCNIHVCIPAKATDAFVDEFATYFANNTDKEVTYEYSNECWNFSFQQTHYCSAQGQSIWPNDGGRHNKWYGYRSAEIMNRISRVYADRTRWRGALCTQTATTGPLLQTLEGVEHWIRSTKAPIQVGDLFNSTYVTGYFGDLVRSTGISGITNSVPAIVTSFNHGYRNGDRLKLFMQTGMKELNNIFVTVGNVTPRTYELDGVNSLNFSPFVAGNNYAVRALIFEIMDRSENQFRKDPSIYPSKYTYFNEQLAESLTSGKSSDGYTTAISVDSLRDKYWPAIERIARKHGLDMRQYEGGAHFVGDTYLNGYGGQPQFTDFLLNNGHSPEMAAVYAKSYEAFFQVGGILPSKFVEAGPTSRYGTWAGIRYWPTVANRNSVDRSNPIWQAVLAANTPR